MTGNRALHLEEPLLFEVGRMDHCGVDTGPTVTPASTLVLGCM